MVSDAYDRTSSAQRVSAAQTTLNDHVTVECVRTVPGLRRPGALLASGERGSDLFAQSAVARVRGRPSGDGAASATFH